MYMIIYIYEYVVCLLGIGTVPRKYSSCILWSFVTQLWKPLPTCTGAAFNVRGCSGLVTSTQKLLFAINLDICSCQTIRANSAQIRCNTLLKPWKRVLCCCMLLPLL